MDLEEVAEGLYALPPEDFVPTRTARMQEARGNGDKVLAKQIGALPKPSTAAWVCNVLVREAPEEVSGLVELGTLVREAQESLAGDRIRELDVQRRRLIAALTRQARSLARQRGHSVSTPVAAQVEETLRAAMADPEAGEALLSGRLTSPLSYSGMGLGGRRPQLRVVPPPAAAAPTEPADGTAGRRSSAEERRRREEEARQAAEEERRRELVMAQQAAEDAEAAAAGAAEAAEAERAEAAELAARAAELSSRIELLTREVARLGEERSAVGADLARVERRRKAADHRRREADAALEHARARARQLTGRAVD